MSKDEQAIPVNQEGKPLDIERSIIRPTIQEAKHSFAIACHRLQRPGTWKDIPGFKGTSFILYKNNKESDYNDVAEVDDYISIDIPWPGPKSGNGKDWVQVEYLEENFDNIADESCGMRVRASINPTNTEEQGTAAHFFKEMATSTFIIKRVYNKVIASYHGRNEVPNLTHAHLTDKVRNAVVAFAALAGFSEMQWTMLLDGFLNNSVNQDKEL